MKIKPSFISCVATCFVLCMGACCPCSKLVTSENSVYAMGDATDNEVTTLMFRYYAGAPHAHEDVFALILSPFLSNPCGYPSGLYVNGVRAGHPLKVDNLSDCVGMPSMELVAITSQKGKIYLFSSGALDVRLNKWTELSPSQKDAVYVMYILFCYICLVERGDCHMADADQELYNKYKETVLKFFYLDDSKLSSILASVPNTGRWQLKPALETHLLQLDTRESRSLYRLLQRN